MAAIVAIGAIGRCSRKLLSQADLAGLVISGVFGAGRRPFQCSNHHLLVEQFWWADFVFALKLGHWQACWMTRLRWSDPPRESDPARVLPDARAPVPVRSSPSGPKAPKSHLFQDCLKAKTRCRKALARWQAAKRRLRAAQAGGATEIKSARKRAAAKAKRDGEIAEAARKLEAAEADFLHAEDTHRELVRRWRETHPDEAKRLDCGS